MAAKRVAAYKVALGIRLPIKTPVELPVEFAFACRRKMRDDYEVWIGHSFNMLRGRSKACTSQDPHRKIGNLRS